MKNTEIGSMRRTGGGRNRTRAIRVVGTRKLAALNEESITLGYNRNLSERFFEDVDPRGRHVLSVVLIHEHAGGLRVKPHYRCGL